MAKNDINSQMFFALYVSEKSGVPFLFMSAPGMGKSTTVELFAKHKGYKLEMLRGNSTTESEIMGYDVVDTTPGAKSTKHLRPSWYGNVLKNSEEGVKTLLFVDEITTCPEHVQSALLHLIFERKVGNERIPDDTLIVSAGNYSQSLGTGFGLIPPLMNRFCIFNIIPSISNIDEFLCHHTGAAIGSVKSFTDIIKEKLDKLDSKAVEYPDDNTLNRIYEIVENALADETKMLSNDKKAGGKDCKIDIKITDVQSIYTDVDNDDPLRGFVTMRTLDYAKKVTVATWLCFGKWGLQDDSFQNILSGLIGLGLTRENKRIVPHQVEGEYFTRLKNAAQEIEKLSNTAVIDYNKFFEDFFKNNFSKKNSKLTKELAGILDNKINAIRRDPKMANISKPIDTNIVNNVFDLIDKAMQPIGAYNLSVDTVTVEKLSADIAEWNIFSDLFTNLGKLVEDGHYSYDETTLNTLDSYKKTVRSQSFKFTTAKKIIMTMETDKNALSLIPEIHRDYVQVK